MMLKINSHIAILPYEPNGTDCGDIGVIVETHEECFLALVDIVGKGAEAAQLASVAEEYLQHNCFLDLVTLMKGLHLCLKGTRGAVAALCRINLASGTLRYVGIGNITVRIWSTQNYCFIPKDGIIGYQMPTPQEKTMNLTAGDILIMHSDGVKEHIDFFQGQKLLAGRAKNMAANMITHFGKKNDDASCIVTRCSYG